MSALIGIIGLLITVYGILSVISSLNSPAIVVASHSVIFVIPGLLVFIAGCILSLKQPKSSESESESEPKKYEYEPTEEEKENASKIGVNL